MRRIAAAAAILWAGLSVMAGAQTLEDGFRCPPKDSWPRVWWHWMNGNISRDGIRSDLLWMDRAGIAGFHNFDAGLSTPQIVDKRITYMTPEWKEAFNYALDIADSLGMEVTVASSPGWSETGGPWVSPDDAMKKLTWREMPVDGGRTFKGALPTPLVSCGMYQDCPQAFDKPGQDMHEYDWYRDVAVIAVKVLPEERSMAEMGTVITSSDPDAPVHLLMDGSYARLCDIHPGKDGISWVQFTFADAYNIKAVTTAWTREGWGGFDRTLEYSEDGKTFHTIFPTMPDTMTMVETHDFTPVRAKCIRLRCNKAGDMLRFSELCFHTVARVNIASEKAGFFTSGSMRDFHPTPSDARAVARADVIDITRHYKDGLLTWRVPEGRWRIYRFGYNLTGKQNGPASPEATGLEVDKFDREAVRRYYHNYLGMYSEASNGRLGSVISRIMIDSYEANCQTWTHAMQKEFKTRRGYDCTIWLPALTGTVIGSAALTEQFLSDWRQTLGELMVENHYDVVNSILEPYGMKRWTESHEARRAFVGDGMDAKRHADIPMSAFWTKASHYASYPMCEADIRESASVAHIYGQNICAAESFTADGSPAEAGRRAWTHAPYNLKRNADAAMACGLNRFVIHCSTHQPSDSHFPGLSLGKYGQWFTRHETWAEEARAWTDYLARSSFMLEQGRFVADVAYYYGETTNITCRFKEARPAVPSGYGYDFVSKSVLLDELSVSGGCLTTRTGMRYRALMIDDEAFYMSVEVLRKIAAIAKAGILVAGNEPFGHCGLMARDKEFKALVKDIWHSGRANVVTHEELPAAMAKAGIRRDFEFLPKNGDDIRFVHRSLGEGGDIYWVANITDHPGRIDVSLRSAGRKPVLWHADTGRMEEPSWRISGDRTVVSLDMSRDDAVFIVMTEPVTGTSHFARPAVRSAAAEVDGPWEVSFQAGRGAPEKAVFDGLKSYTESSDPGIRYFSGTAVYRSTFEMGVISPDSEYEISLGRVCHMARVFLNGHDLGLVWKEPYTVAAGAALRQGQNAIEIKVINSWVNRLIGDEQPGAERITYVGYPQYQAQDRLEEAGLLGPVVVTEAVR